MTSDIEKIRIQQAHLDGAEIEIKQRGYLDAIWQDELNPSWNWEWWAHRIKEKQYFFADGSLVTEEAKRGKFVYCENKGTAVFLLKVGAIPMHGGDARFEELNGGAYFDITWKELLPYTEPEYIPFDKDSFPFEPVWISIKGNSVRFLVTIVEEHRISDGGSHSLGYQCLLDRWELVNSDETRSPCGVEVVK